MTYNNLAEPYIEDSSGLSQNIIPSLIFCGGGEIRTHETVSGLTVFKTVPFNRSGTPPSDN